MPIGELRYPVYQAVTDRLLNQDHIVALIGAVKWDIKEIMSQHNSYVDIILMVSWHTHPSFIIMNSGYLIQKIAGSHEIVRACKKQTNICNKNNDFPTTIR